MWKNYGFLGYLILLSIWDLKERKIPVVWLGVGAVAVAVSVLCDIVGGDVLWYGRFLGALPGLFLLAVSWLSGKIGAADGIIMILIGLLKGYKECVLILGLSLFGTAIFCIAFLLFGKFKGTTQIPFIPFLTITCVILEGLIAF